jgi:NAD(P)H-dependent FMN reductase
MTAEQLAGTMILAISGSLQSRSSNSALIRLAGELADECTTVEVFDTLDRLPYFNPEHDLEPAPPSVADWRARVGAADAVLIASPEYAHEMPGVLKNALDWLVSSGELYGKRVAVLSAAPARERGVYAREALQRTLEAEGATVVLSATVTVTPADRASDSPSATAVQPVTAALQALLVGS